MARPSPLPALRTLLIALTAGAAFATAALAAPSAEPADRQLEAESSALPTPTLGIRLQARAAAYRVVLQTAEQLGFDAAAVERMARAQRAPVVLAARIARD